MNISLLLEMVSDAAPGRVVLGPRDNGITAGGLRRLTDDTAAWFSTLGVQHVGFLGLNSPAFPVTLLSAARAGIPFAPLNFRLPDTQLRGLFERIAPGILVADADMAARAGGIEGLEVVSGEQVLSGVSSGTQGSAEPPFIDPDQVAVLLFTSGTTGQPKAALLRHRHLTAYILGTVEFLGADDDEAQLVSVPAYHIAGVAGALSSLYSGRRVVYLPAFEPHQWVGLVRAESVTQAMVVPTMLERIIEVLADDGGGLPRLRHLSYGGGKAPVALVERAMRLLPGVKFVNAYGLTETSSTIAALTPDDHRVCFESDDPAVRRRLGSVGRPLPSVEVEIRDPEGKAVAPGVRGEIHVRGDQVSGEYATGSVLGEGRWFATRDAGWVDDEGFLFLDGRLDDVIVRGGENLSPGEIEETLLEHPAVAEAAVVGVPDPEWGEAVGAVVVLHEGAVATVTDLQEFVRDRLRSTKTPQVIQVRDELPYNETGKLLRRVIKDSLAGSPAE
jgi:acyl-CoA synthetase (AMP-forming)/AMP-acid ligase II